MNDYKLLSFISKLEKKRIILNKSIQPSGLIKVR